MGELPMNPVKYLLGCEVLGQGANGVVNLGTVISTGEQVAIKRIMIDKAKRQRKRIATELSCMKKLSHTCLLPLLDVYMTQHSVNIVTPIMPSGNLLTLIQRSQKGLSPAAAFYYFWQIVSGIHHCHINHICHRDIKAENVLLDEFLNAKVADFGYARSVGENESASTRCGSPEYMAPEVFQSVYNPKKADVWSLGVLLFAMAFGVFPFIVAEGDAPCGNARRIEETRFPPRTPPPLRDMFMSMCCIDPIQRLGIEGVMGHEYWLQGCKLFQLDPHGCHHPDKLFKSREAAVAFFTKSQDWRVSPTEVSLQDIPLSPLGLQPSLDFGRRTKRIMASEPPTTRREISRAVFVWESDKKSSLFQRLFRCCT